MRQEVRRRRLEARHRSDKGGKVYAVDNQDVLHGHEGHHVTVTGAVTGMSIHVSDVAMTPTK